MEDGTLTNGDLPAAAAEDVEVEVEYSEEVNQLKQQVEFLSKDMKASRSTISQFESQFDGYLKQRGEMVARIEELEAQVKAMDSVMARASELEGDVVRLRDDLINSIAEAEEAAAEVRELREKVEKLTNEKLSLDVVVASLEERLASMVIEKGEVDDEVAKRDERIAELESLVSRLKEEKTRIEVELGEEKTRIEVEWEEEKKGLVDKLERTLKELVEKDEHIEKAQRIAEDATSELRRKVKEVEIEGGAENSYMKSHLAVAAATTVTVVAAAGIFYLRHTKRS